MGWLHELLGDYTAFFTMCAQEIVTLFLYTVALTWYKKKRRLCWLRFIFCFAISLTLCIPLGMLRTHYNTIPVRIFNTFVMLLLIIGTLFVCYRERANEIMLCFAGIVAAKNFSGQIFALMLNIFGVDDLVSMSFFAEYNPTRDWIIYFAVHIALLAGIYLFLRKRENLKDRTSNARAIWLAVMTMLVAAVLSTFTRVYQAESFALSVCIKVFQLIVYAFILIMRSDIFFRSKIKQELLVTEELLNQEKKHYAEMRNNIDLINMKCHDIRHQLDNFQGRLTERELDELRDAIHIYDSNIKTGNEILDAILFQKKLYCEKNGIRLKFIADGKLVNFFDGNDLYALLANALDNAVENVSKLNDAAKRIINLSIGSEGGLIVIEASNYFDPSDKAENGTTKTDKTHHGYGIKSMQYIAQKYRGSLSIQKDGDIFTLIISVPVSKPATILQT